MKQNDLDVLMLKAGTVIHFHGMPVYLTDNTKVLGCAANFVLDTHGIFVDDSKMPEPIKVDAQGHVLG